MLPDKNELIDELVEQIGGGEVYIDFSDDEFPNKTMQYFGCKKCYGFYKAYKPSESSLCPNCELKPSKTAISTSDIKTTVPEPSNNDRLVKIH